MNKKKICTFIIAMGMLIMLLTGCGGGNKGTSSTTGEAEGRNGSVSVSVIVGAHSNANVISVNSDAICDQVYNCTYSYGTCSLIRCDGKPEEFLKVNIDEPEVKGLSDAKLKAIAENYRDEILAYFNTHGTAKYAEVDTLEAIRLAANSLKMADGDEKYLVIADTGLSTTGYVNFYEDDLFNVDTREIISELINKKAIPDLTGTEIIWLYAGQTAEPQEKLSEVQKSKLIEIWNALLEEAGAESIEFRFDSSTSKPYTDLPKVSVVGADKRDIDVTPLKTVVLDSQSVAFNGDAATFVDKDKAEKAIQSVAFTLKNNPQNKVYLCGCTASSMNRSDEFLANLSYDRAYAVMEVLRDYGVPDNQMQVVGLGDKAPWHIGDLDSNGYQVEEKAEQNRCVVVIDTLDKDYGSIINTLAE